MHSPPAVRITDSIPHLRFPGTPFPLYDIKFFTSDH